MTAPPTESELLRLARVELNRQKPTAVLLCPITSRNCGRKVADQPIFRALLPSLKHLRGNVRLTLLLGYDSDDAIWANPDAREQVRAPFPVLWYELHALRGNITGIWNWLARNVATDYLLPVNDDLEFRTNPLKTIEALAARGNFGTVAFWDHAFPDLPTFYVVHRTHLEIFDVLYPLPWPGAHQDSWIADIYRPWRASDIDRNVIVHNRMGGITAARFEYGGLVGYRDRVLWGRRKVNAWLMRNQTQFQPMKDEELEAASMVVTEAEVEVLTKGAI